MKNLIAYKINYVFIKIQNTNTLDVKTCPQSCLLFVFGQGMKAIAVHSSMSEAQGGGLIRDQFPSNTTPARRESQSRYGQIRTTEWSIYS